MSKIQDRPFYILFFSLCTTIGILFFLMLLLVIQAAKLDRNADVGSVHESANVTDVDTIEDADQQNDVEETNSETPEVTAAASGSTP